MAGLPLLLLFALAPPEVPGAFALLDQVGRAYRALTSYADAGEILVEQVDGGTARFRFETRYHDGRGSYLLERLGDRSPDAAEPPALWAAWADVEGVFLYDGESDSYRPAESMGAALTHMLGAERRSAALVALLLLAREDPLSSPLAASVAGSNDCGRSRCWTIDVAPEAGPDLRLQADADSHLVRAAEITVDAIAALARESDVDRALRDASTRPRGRARGTRLTVRYQLATDPVAAAAIPWVPPATARPATETRIAAEPDRSPDASPPARGRVFAEEIEVRLSTLTVRVIDAGGRPIRDLGPADFRVRVGGEPARVESVDWIAPGNERFSPEELAELARTGRAVPAAGRLVVVFVQTDLHPSRAPGHLRLLPELRKLLATFHPEDEIAVVSFDSHLKLRQDFTGDRLLVEDALTRAVRLSRAPAVEPGRFPSLARHLDFHAARRAANPERALRVVAEALLPLPGEKILVFAGWGLGRYSAGSVQMTPEYDETREALARARATVFVLDVTQADYHSLEIGLETIAEDTGGTYEKTFRWPAQMTERLAHTLEGHYEITFAAPPRSERGARVRVELVGRGGQVLVRPTRR